MLDGQRINSCETWVKIPDSELCNFSGRKTTYFVRWNCLVVTQIINKGTKAWYKWISVSVTIYVVPLTWLLSWSQQACNSIMRTLLSEKFAQFALLFPPGLLNRGTQSPRGEWWLPCLELTFGSVSQINYLIYHLPLKQAKPAGQIKFYE